MSTPFQTAFVRKICPFVDLDQFQKSQCGKSAWIVPERMSVPYVVKINGVIASRPDLIIDLFGQRLGVHALS
jgi:hypothetical protein